VCEHAASKLTQFGFAHGRLLPQHHKCPQRRIQDMNVPRRLGTHRALARDDIAVAGYVMFNAARRRTTATDRGKAMSFPFDLLIHAANVLYLFAFMVRDLLWFRILAVVAAVCLISYFYFRPEPLVAPI
jgi:hypothetical protein